MCFQSWASVVDGWPKLKKTLKNIGIMACIERELTQTRPQFRPPTEVS